MCVCRKTHAHAQTHTEGSQREMLDVSLLSVFTTVTGVQCRANTMTAELVGHTLYTLLFFLMHTHRQTHTHTHRHTHTDTRRVTFPHSYQQVHKIHFPRHINKKENFIFEVQLLFTHKSSLMHTANYTPFSLSRCICTQTHTQTHTHA